MVYDISLELLVVILVSFIGLMLFIKKLAMPADFKKNQEFFAEKLRQRITITPDYFGVVKEIEPGDLVSQEEEDEDSVKPVEK